MSHSSAASITPDSPAISRIGRFYITRELGRGTVGCVYLGHDPVMGRDVAIKTWNPRLTLIEKSIYKQQFLNEARAAGRLSHPNIVTIYDASIENGATYIAMEYLQGQELNKLLDSGHRFKPDEAASIIWRIADALDHAHRNGVVHRDIKPANIFMTKDNQPKLVDFGIARAPNRVSRTTDNAAGDQAHTIFRPNHLLGTPNYMSPEQALGKPVNALTDIYSLGAVMYEMLVGQKPFQSDDTDKLLNLIAYKTSPAPHKAVPGIPPALSQIVKKAMSKRVEKRYQTAEAMALDIKRYLRRARRPMKIPMPAVERHQAKAIPLGRRLLFWGGYLSFLAAAAITGFILWR